MEGEQIRGRVVFARVEIELDAGARVVLAEDRGKGSGSRGHTLDMCPAAWERGFEEFTREFFGPVGLVHVIKVTEARRGRARTRQAVLGTSRSTSLRYFRLYLPELRARLCHLRNQTGPDPHASHGPRS